MLICCTSANSDKNRQSEPQSEVEEIMNWKHMLVFTKIDNNVKVLVNDSLVFSSGLIPDSPELDLRVDLTPFVKDGTEKLKIELYNGQEPYADQLDPFWELRYDLILNGEISDFDHVLEKNNALGLVYQSEYLVSEWWSVEK